MENANNERKTSMKNVKDENYYIVHGWIKNRLGLKGTKRDIYAIIYGFSQDGESEFTGSLKYFEEWLDVSRPTIIKALQELTESGFVIKRAEIINGVQFNRYKASLQVVKNFYGGSKEILQGGSKETLPNNKDINNNIDKEKKKESKQATFNDLFIKYAKGLDVADRIEVVDLLIEWLKVRKAKRSAMTDRAIELNLTKLDKCARESNLTVAEYLKEVICRGWQAFYPIKNYNTKQEQSGGIMDDYNNFNELLQGE